MIFRSRPAPRRHSLRRLLLAAEPKVLSEVLAVVQRGISTCLIRRSGLIVASGARTGAVTLIQRFGSALNLNPHLHMLFLDGAYSFGGSRAIFHRARRPQREDIVRLLHSLSGRIVRLLERRGLRDLAAGFQRKYQRLTQTVLPQRNGPVERSPEPIKRGGQTTEREAKRNVKLRDTGRKI